MTNNTNHRQAPRNNFRSIMHIVMGLLYLGIGSTVLYLKNFGNIQLPPGLAYAIGILMLAYGGFRVWRGWKDMQQNSNQKS